MENKKTALENYSKLCASNAPIEQRVAAWDKYISIANAPRSNSTCATRKGGRRFFGRYDSNGNYHDVS